MTASLAKFARHQEIAFEQTMEEAFPVVEPGVVPFGSRVLVQFRRSRGRSRGGIVLTDEAKAAEKWNTQVAKVLALGDVAFKNRTTLKEWPEGRWARPGDFVRVPKYQGDRWEVPYGKGEDEVALFAIFNDLEVIGRVTTDPRAIRAFI